MKSNKSPPYKNKQLKKTNLQKFIGLKSFMDKISAYIPQKKKNIMKNRSV